MVDPLHMVKNVLRGSILTPLLLHFVCDFDSKRSYVCCNCLFMNYCIAVYSDMTGTNFTMVFLKMPRYLSPVGMGHGILFPVWSVCIPYSDTMLKFDRYSWAKREDCHDCPVLCCIWQLHTTMWTHTWAVLKDECWFRFRFSSVHLGLFLFFFWFSLDYFVLTLFAFVVLGFVSSVVCQEIGMGRMSPKWPILCRVRLITLTQ